MKRSVIGSFIAGATFMYFADPNRGRRRRAVARDKFMAGLRDVSSEFDKAGRDLWNRAQGAAATARSAYSGSEVDGAVLVQRVRSAIGRATSHPHAIRVRCEGNGRIVLEGPILRHELDYLLKRVRSTRGVKEVASRLEIYIDRSGVSSLQGGVQRRQLPEIAQENWTPSLRVASGAAAGFGLYAGLREGGPLGLAAAFGSAALLGRAVLNKSFAQMFGIGGPPAVHIDKTIHIDAQVEQVYAFWSNFENFPKFMTHLKEVRHLRNGRSHWVAAGPGGVSIPWDAEITEERPNQLLAWKSVPGSVVQTCGSVRFDPEPDGSTRLSLRMTYCPPAGFLGHALACLFATDPKTEIDDDLVRLKSLIEIGKTRAHGAPIRRDEIAVASPGGQQQA